MLYVFYGDDRLKIAEKVRDLVGKLQAKRPDASVFSFDPDTWDAARFEEMIGAQTLFVGKSIIVGRGLLGSALSADAVLKQLKEIATSDNIFFLEEGALKKDVVSKLEKKAEKIQEFSLPKAKEKKEKTDFSVYALSDALGARDRRSLWVAYQRAQHAGLVSEEIFWKLVWQVKNMLLVTTGSKAPTAESLKMNPYVFSKASSSARNFKQEELISLHRDLLVLWHEMRRGKTDFAHGIERFILDL